MFRKGYEEMNRYKYKYEDLHCDYCADKKTKVCKAEYCPHIMENIAELLDESGFMNAVEKAEQCLEKYKRTLLYLKNQPDELICVERSCDGFIDEEPMSHCEYRKECQLCRYSGHGFSCYSKRDGSCLRDWLKQIKNKN